MVLRVHVGEGSLHAHFRINDDLLRNLPRQASQGTQGESFLRDARGEFCSVNEA